MITFWQRLPQGFRESEWLEFFLHPVDHRDDLFVKGVAGTGSAYVCTCGDMLEVRVPPDRALEMLLRPLAPLGDSHVCSIEDHGFVAGKE